MQIDYKEEFLKFLKEKDLEDKFKSNMESESNSTGITTIEDRVQLEVKGETPDEAVFGAFIWGSTPEGIRFWDTIDGQWKEKCKELGC